MIEFSYQVIWIFCYSVIQLFGYLAILLYIQNKKRDHINIYEMFSTNRRRQCVDQNQIIEIRLKSKY